MLYLYKQMVKSRDSAQPVQYNYYSRVNNGNTVYINDIYKV